MLCFETNEPLRDILLEMDQSYDEVSYLKNDKWNKSLAHVQMNCLDEASHI